ncbi:hypothetical protein BH23BAC4_BH23BAC4_09370 [soil metagenome]
MDDMYSRRRFLASTAVVGAVALSPAALSQPVAPDLSGGVTVGAAGYDTGRLQRQLDNAALQDRGSVTLAQGTYVVDDTIRIPHNVSVRSDGATFIVADFANWRGATTYTARDENGNVQPYVAAVLIETSPRYPNPAFATTGRGRVEIEEKGWRRTIEVFVAGTGNRNRLTAGVVITAATGTGPQAFSLRHAQAPARGLQMSYLDIHTMGFDKGMVLREAWMSTFRYSSRGCRIGLSVEGKTVGAIFEDIYLFEPQNAPVDFLQHTSFSALDTEFQLAEWFRTQRQRPRPKTWGVVIDSGFHYEEERDAAGRAVAGSSQGRPEGLVFRGGTIFGYDTAVRAHRALWVLFDGVNFDGSVDHTITVMSVHSLMIQNCYIGNSGIDTASVFFYRSPGVHVSHTLSSNHFSTVHGVRTVGVRAEGHGNIRVVDNEFVGPFQHGVHFNYVVRSIVRGNTGRYLTNALISLGSGCEGTVVDQNFQEDQHPVVRMLPSTSHEVEVGANRSAVQRTGGAGSIRVAAGQSRATLPSGLLFAPGVLVASIVTVASVTPDPGGWRVVQNDNSFDGTLIFNTPLRSSVVVHFTARAVPFSAV